MALALASAVLALPCAVHCDGERFSSDSAAGSGGTTGGAEPQGGSATGGSSSGGASGGVEITGGSNSGGKSGAAGAHSGGTASEAGGAEAGGSDSGGQGEGGAGGDSHCDAATACPEGSYCGAEGSCVACSDITTLGNPGAAKFGVAEPLTLINQSAGDWFLRSPRAFGSGKALLYVRDYFGGEIWLTGDAETDIGTPLPSPINDPNSYEYSPLWLDRADGPVGMLDFVFNRAAKNAPHELFTAHLAANGTSSDVTRMPAPFNPTPALSESVYSMAVSKDRAWWVVNHDLKLSVQVLTAPLDQSGPPSIVPLRASADCALAELDFNPWVTPDGKLLFVNATERKADCSHVSGTPTDIAVIRLNEAGQALGPAIPLSSVNRPETSDLDASLSADQCTLYFVTNVMGKPRLMKARRSG
jgi:hypothetical protein